MILENLDFQAIFFGDAWINPLVMSFDTPNEFVWFHNGYYDLEGSLAESYDAIGTLIDGIHINITHFEYGVWNDFRTTCDGTGPMTIRGDLFV